MRVKVAITNCSGLCYCEVDSTNINIQFRLLITFFFDIFNPPTFSFSNQNPYTRHNMKQYHQVNKSLQHLQSIIKDLHIIQEELLKILPYKLNSLSNFLQVRKSNNFEVIYFLDSLSRKNTWQD